LLLNSPEIPLGVCRVHVQSKMHTKLMIINACQYLELHALMTNLLVQTKLIQIEHDIICCIDLLHYDCVHRMVVIRIIPLMRCLRCITIECASNDVHVTNADVVRTCCTEL